ncbi:MAG TPA: site-specific integrase, partial [Paraburkholderia sp.]|nr:site-specific integrase [Paraburkholderia sp.]
MPTITPRKNKDGSLSYKVQIRIRKDGKVLHQETKTFERKQAAAAWAKRRESELNTAEGLRAALRENPTLQHMIKRYIEELKKPLDRTKKVILNQMADSDFGQITAAELTSSDIAAYVQALNIAPSTRGHYLAHLSSVVRIARPVWNYPIDPSVVADARTALTRMGLVGRSNQRDRRPTLDELDLLMEYFGARREGDPESAPMQVMVAFTIFSMRRVSEICRLMWNDLDEEGCRVMVRDLKHPNT